MILGSQVMEERRENLKGMRESPWRENYSYVLMSPPVVIEWVQEEEKNKEGEKEDVKDSLFLLFFFLFFLMEQRGLSL